MEEDRENNRRRVDMNEVKKCIECEGEFLLTEGEKKFFADKEFPFPRRCPTCRKIRRDMKKRIGH